MGKILNPAIIAGVFAVAALLGVGQAFAQNLPLAPVGVGGPVIQAGTIVNNILVGNKVAFVGDFDYSVDQNGSIIPNSQNLVFWDGAQWLGSPAPMNQETKAYAEFLGIEFLSTEDGIYKRNGTQWVKAFGSSRPVWTIFATNSYMLYVEQNDETNDGGGFVGEIFFSTDGVSSESIGTVGNLIRSFTEYNGKAYYGSEIWPEGGTESYENVGAIDLESMNIISFPKPGMEYTFNSMRAIGVFNEKLYMRSMVSPWEYSILSFDGFNWVEEYGGSILDAVITNNELYILSPDEALGAQILKEVDGVLVPVSWNENQMLPNDFFFFGDSYYMSNRGLFIYFVDGEQQTISSVLIRLQDPALSIANAVEKIVIHPNPADNYVEIDGLKDVSVYNAYGEQILVDNVAGTTSINTTDFLPGVYILLAENIEGERVTTRFVVQHSK